MSPLRATQPIVSVRSSPMLVDDGSAKSPVPVRRTFYQQHLVAAQYFADGAREAELGGDANAGRDAVRRYRDLVVESVRSAASFLELSVNELYLDLQEGGVSSGRRHSRLMHVRLSHEWHAHQLAPTVQKFQLLLSLWDADPFHPGHAPFVQVDRLMRWRDFLALRSTRPRLRVGHASPAHERDSLTLHLRASLTQRPRVGWLRLNSECAQWAVDSAVNFSGEFCRRMSLPAREFGEPTG